jgi:hypothetical protein
MSVIPEQHIETNRNAHPQCGPGEGFLECYLLLLLGKQPEVDEQHQQDKEDEDEKKDYLAAHKGSLNMQI